MREYIQPGFAKSQKQREVEKLTAVLQALKNCHGALGTIQGGEELFQAKEDLADLFLRLDAIRMEKMNALEPNAVSNAIEVELDDTENELALLE